jgi:hypothetical protein
MKKLYYLLFYKLYRFGKTVSDDNWSDWKALLIVEVLNGFILSTIDISIQILFNKSFILDLPKPTFIILFAAFSLLHYYFFLHNNNWKQYIEEFKGYSSGKNNTINFLVFLFILMVLCSLIFAFYQMSLIDWSRYR